MKININKADQFTEVYKEFLLDVFKQYESDDDKIELIEKLVIGRKYFSSNRKLFTKWIKKNKNVSKDIVSSIETIEIGKWIYLKDTKHYSILIGMDGLSGYGVLGLTDKIRDIIKKPPVAIEAGIMSLGGRFVCDGLIQYLADIGPNYKKEYNQRFKILKENQQFKSKSSV